DTLVTTLGRHPEKHQGMVNTPVYRTSTILFPTLTEFEASQKGDGVKPLIYGRAGTPAVHELEQALAELDKADHALLTPSGQMAIVVVFTSMLSKGDHVL